ncbi:MAG: cbb3-type cytochrome c oxidase subunit I [Candidatus Brocadiales bacterium]
MGKTRATEEKTARGLSVWWFLNDEEDSAARNFILSSVVWLGLVVSVAMVLALKFVWPDFLSGVAWLSFGRLRPFHVNGALFGWLSMASIGIMFYILPKLTGVRLWSERLGNVTCLLWNIVIVLSAVSLPLGYTQGREYAEYVLPLDLILLLCLMLLLYNVFNTVAMRKERGMYVSLWYFLATLIWAPFIFLVGNNFMMDMTGLGGRGAVPGINDAMLNWWYGHNVIGMWFSTLGLGIFYYFLPVLTKNPLYSHRLSMIGFWTLAFFYVWNGQHHLVYGPGPDWLESVAIAFSVLMVIPVFAVVYNFFKTARGKWHLMFDNSYDALPLRFLMVGGLAYFLTCTQGPLINAPRTTNAYFHFTYWTVGHAHLAFLGSFSFISMAAIYHVIPRITGTQVNLRLANWHFGLFTAGLIIFLGILHTAGILQGAMWMAKIEEIDFMTDTVVLRPAVEFIDVVRALHPYYFTLMIGAALMVAGIMTFVVNVLRTAYVVPQPVPKTAPPTVRRKAGRKGGRRGTRK